jgi:hypothetical protein
MHDNRAVDLAVSTVKGATEYTRVVQDVQKGRGGLSSLEVYKHVLLCPALELVIAQLSSQFWSCCVTSQIDPVSRKILTRPQRIVVQRTYIP